AVGLESLHLRVAHYFMRADDLFALQHLRLDRRHRLTRPLPGHLRRDPVETDARLEEADQDQALQLRDRRGGTTRDMASRAFEEALRGEYRITGEQNLLAITTEPELRHGA